MWIQVLQAAWLHLPGPAVFISLCFTIWMCRPILRALVTRRRVLSRFQTGTAYVVGTLSCGQKTSKAIWADWADWH